MKNKLYKYFYIVSIILLLLFLISLVVDYINYNALFTSAPFYVNVLIRFIEFGILSIIFLIVAILLQKKSKK